MSNNILPLCRGGAQHIKCTIYYAAVSRQPSPPMDQQSTVPYTVPHTFCKGSSTTAEAMRLRWQDGRVVQVRRSWLVGPYPGTLVHSGQANEAPAPFHAVRYMCNIRRNTKWAMGKAPLRTLYGVFRGECAGE